MTTTIEQRPPYATLINVFVVSPDRADELARVLREATEQTMRYVPGFISANIHVSTDGSRVVNYAQWEKVEDFQAMLADPAARVHMDQCASIATSFDPHIYTVESVHARG